MQLFSYSIFADSVGSLNGFNNQQKNEPYHIMISSYTFPIADSKFRNIYLITAIVVVRCLFHHSQKQKRTNYDTVWSAHWTKKAVRIRFTLKFCRNSNQQSKSCSLNTSSHHHMWIPSYTKPLNRTNTPTRDHDTIRCEFWMFENSSLYCYYHHCNHSCCELSTLKQ